MNHAGKWLISILVVIGLSGCAEMSTRQKNAAAGAAIGGVAGAVLTGGSSFGTVGGAAIGGIIGHGVDGFSGRK
jgi:osmotically inducible lipoprotein OsmB